MEEVWRHIERDNRVLRAELIKFGTTMAAVPVKDQESISADRTGLGMLVKHLYKGFPGIPRTFGGRHCLYGCTRGSGYRKGLVQLTLLENYFYIQVGEVQETRR
jgi:hypothetical protein